MGGDDQSLTTLSFGDFRLDLDGLELRKNGVKLRLRHQPAQVLALLIQRPGKIVTREEIQREIWGAGTFVDFERGLNNCVKQIREVLNDDAENPRYIETLPRQGYRFVARVEAIAHNGESHVASAPALGVPVVTAQSVVDTSTAIQPSKSGRRLGVWFGALAGVLSLSAGAMWLLIGRPVFSFHERDAILVADFDNHTGDPRFDDALLTAFTVSLEQSRYANVVSRSRVYSALQRMGRSPKDRVTPEIGREICQREDIRGLLSLDLTRTGKQYALTAQLIDPASGASVRSYSERVYGDDHILDALDKVSGDVRADLGESLYQIHRANKSLPQVTTASLDALKDYAEARSLWRSAKYNDALALYQSAVRLDPGFAMAHAALGNAYCSHVFNYQRERCAEEYKSALSLSSRVTEREKRLIELKSTADLGPSSESDRLFLLYLADYPDDWSVRYNYANGLRLHARGKEAIDQYKELLRTAPNDAGTYLGIAASYKVLGRPIDALEAYSQAFRLDPAMLNISNLNREYGFTLIGSGEEQKAEQVFSVLCANRSTRGSCLHSLGLVDLMHGRYAKARERFTQALALAEESRDPFLTARNHFLLAVVAAGQASKARQFKELEAALSDFKNLGPKVEYGSLVGQEYARAGNVGRAEKIERDIAPLADPNSDEQTAYLRLLRGEISLTKGDPKAAASFFDLEDPRYGEPSRLSIEAMGRADQKAGNIDGAIASYERLFESGGCPFAGWEPQHRCVDARIALVNLYLARGNKQKATAQLTELLKNWKDADPDVPIVKQVKAEYAKLQ